MTFALQAPSSSFLAPPTRPLLMQLLKANCPFCGNEVETTLEHVGEPIVCPSCEKPFEMEIPTAEVTSVREVSESEAAGMKDIADEPEERTLYEVHPAVFRARPLATLILVAVLIACVFGLGYSLWSDPGDIEFAAVGEANGLLWLSLAGLLGCALVIASWFLRSALTTLKVTDQRTIFTHGIIARDTSEVQHDDVRNIQIDQSVIQRLLGVGEIGISSSGQDDLEIVAKRIPHPEKLVEVIRKNQD